MAEEVRWQQRFVHYKNALTNLGSMVAESNKRELNIMEQQGMIQAFEMTHELAWKVLKDYFAYQGNSNITGSRDAFRAAFTADLIEDGEAWMESILSRNITTHAYNQETAEEINNKIIHQYYPMFAQLSTKLETLSDAK